MNDKSRERVRAAAAPQPQPRKETMAISELLDRARGWDAYDDPTSTGYLVAELIGQIDVFLARSAADFARTCEGCNAELPDDQVAHVTADDVYLCDACWDACPKRAVPASPWPLTADELKFIASVLTDVASERAESDDQPDGAHDAGILRRIARKAATLAFQPLPDPPAPHQDGE